MIRSDAEALAAEIAAHYPKRIDAHVAFYRVKMPTGIEQFTVRVKLLTEGGRTATIYRRSQWDSLIMAWQLFFENDESKGQSNDPIEYHDNPGKEAARLCVPAERADARSREQGW